MRSDSTAADRLSSSPASPRRSSSTTRNGAGRSTEAAFTTRCRLRQIIRKHVRSGTIYVPNTTDPAAIAKFAADGLTPGQAFPNDTIPTNLIDPVAAAYIKAGYFQPPNASDGIHYFSSANTDTYFREEIARGDHQFNEKFSVMGNLIYDSLSQQVPRSRGAATRFPPSGPWKPFLPGQRSCTSP